MSEWPWFLYLFSASIFTSILQVLTKILQVSLFYFSKNVWVVILGDLLGYYGLPFCLNTVWSSELDNLIYYSCDKDHTWWKTPYRTLASLVPFHDTSHRKSKPCDSLNERPAALSSFISAHLWFLPIWTSRTLHLSLLQTFSLPCSAFFLTQCFPHTLSPGKCERQPGKSSMVCKSQSAYTACQQMAIFYHYYTVWRPFICGLREKEASALWCDTCHRSFTPH